MVFLLLAIFSRWRYDVYVFLRVVVCGSAVYVAARAHSMRRSGWVWIMGAVALLFNPFLPVRLHRSGWQVLNFVAVVVFAASMLALRAREDRGRSKG